MARESWFALAVQPLEMAMPSKWDRIAQVAAWIWGILFVLYFVWEATR